MTTFPILLAALAAASGPHKGADGDQAFLALLAETKTMRMAGMKPITMPNIDLSKLPPGVKIPNMANLGMMSGKPTRILNVRLWSPTIAPDGATASIVPPAGLKQGDKLNLELYRPTGSAETGGMGSGQGPDSNPEFTIKIYWGSSKTVREGQPKIISFSGLTPEQKAAMKARAQQARQGANNYFYKAGWTTGYWPTSSEPGQIDDDASLVGKYSLTSSYTGNVEIEAPSNVDFLAGIKMNTPDLSQKTDFSSSLPFSWDPIPNVLGQFASIMGAEGKNTMVFWTSSEEYSPGIMGDMGFLQMSDVRNYVANKTFMPGDQTNVDVPAGIFANADFAMFNMVGYGPGTALDKAQPLPRIQTKTTMQIMLGGKKMNMNRRGGGGGEEKR